MTQPLNLSPETLLAQTDWLRFLARQLVQGQDNQNDLVQETYLQTLRRPPTDARLTGAFMARVMRRLAARRGQREGQRHRVESNASCQVTKASPKELVERLTIQRDLVDSLLGISAAHRDVLILRFYEDLGPKEIANRLNIPLATAKSRLQRGLRELREKMSRTYGNDDQLIRSLAPLAALAGFSEPQTVTGATTLFLAKITGVAALVLFAIWSVREFADETDNLSSEEVPLVAESDSPRRNRSAQRSRLLPPTRQNQESEPHGPVEDAGPLAQVVDANGRGIPGVSIAVESQVLNVKRTVWSGRTAGPHGTVDLRAAMATLKESNLCGLFSIRLGFPSLNAPQAPLNLEKEMNWPIKLTMPKTGNVDLVVLNHDGKPHSGRVGVSVNGGSPERLEEKRFKGSMTSYTTKAQANAISIPHVGIGLSLFLRVHDLDSERPVAHVRILGPTKQGQSLKVVVSLPPPYPIIRGQLLLPSGTIKGSHPFQGIVTNPSAKAPTSFANAKEVRTIPQAFDVEIDSRGRFECVWRFEGSHAAQQTLTIGEAIGGSAFKKHALGLGATTTLSFLPGKRFIDVGQVKLSASPTLMIGRVLDDAGSPVAGAKVTASVKKITDSRRGGMRNKTVIGLAYTDAAGRFLIKGATEAEEIILSAKAKDHGRHKAVTVPRQNKETNLTLIRGGGIEGRLILQSPLDAWGLEIRTVQESSYEWKGRTVRRPRTSFATSVRNGGIGRDGHFILRGLQPGECQVKISVAGNVIKSFESLLIKAGETISPKELANIELGTIPSVFKVTLRNELGVPLAGSSVRFEKKTKGRFTVQTSMTGARLDETGSFWTTRSTPDQKVFEAVVLGFKPQSIPIEGRELSANLQRGPVVVVSLAQYQEFAKENTEIRVTLLRSFGRKKPSISVLQGARYMQVLKSGTATFQVSAGGEFEIRIQAIRNGMRRSEKIDGLDPRSVIVRDGTQEVQIARKEK